MRGQRKFNATGTSSLSALDVGLGIGIGFGVPAVADMALQRWGTDIAAIQGTEGESTRRMIAGGIGIVASLPVYYWRGLAPTILGASLAVVYAIGPQVSSWLTGAMTPAAFGRAAQFGRLQRARGRRPAMALGDLQRARGEAPAMVAAGAVRRPY